MSNLGVGAYEKLQAFEPVLSREGIQVVKKILLEETATEEDMVSNGIFEEIKSTSRSNLSF